MSRYVDKNRVYFFIFFIFVFSCKEKELKKCINLSKNEETKLYNELTSQLINSFFGTKFLGEKKEYVDSIYFSFRVNHITKDSIKSIKEHIRIHNELFNDKDKFLNLYIDTLKTDRNIIGREYIRKIENKYQNLGFDFKDTKYFKKNLNLYEVLKSKDFDLCTANVLDIGGKKIIDYNSTIGLFSISKVVFNTKKNRAMVKVLFRYNCEQENKCNDVKSALFILEKVDNYWEIIEMDLLSIS
jgi:hypothetical protein